MDLTERRGMPGLAYPEEYLKRLAGDLTEKFAGVFNAETIERYVLESYTGLLRTSTVRTHLASRTIHFATDRLTALAQAKGAIERTVPEAVSYTHLDVYKRQRASGAQQAAASFTVRGNRVAVDTVSYTHLDVYKRQPSCESPMGQL